MKVVYEPGELDRIVEAGKATRFNIFDRDPDRKYGLTFSVTNPELASQILVSLMHDRLEDFELGIKIHSIELNPMVEKEVFKDKLLSAINQIFEGRYA